MKASYAVMAEDNDLVLRVEALNLLREFLKRDQDGALDSGLLELPRFPDVQ
jgi:hypothetical protein